MDWVLGVQQGEMSSFTLSEAATIGGYPFQVTALELSSAFRFEVLVESVK